jgi:hypothetical protein
MGRRSDNTPALVAVMAAIPAHVIVGQSHRGRARTAIAFLAAFGAGLAMTIALGVIVASFREDSPDVVPLAIFGAFVGPFIGMARAAWLRPQRRSRARSNLKQPGRGVFFNLLCN